MRTDLPSSMQDSLQELSPDALVTLFKLTMNNGFIVRFTPHKELTWLGDTYSEIPCNFPSVGQDPQGKANRPKFTFVNPGGVFSSSIQKGFLNNAELIRYRALYGDVVNNINAKLSETFTVTRIVSLNKDIVVAECRDIFDGPMFKIPARTYNPPEFPHVNLR